MRPSIAPGEKPATSSKTWAWKYSPLIGEPGVPGAAQPLSGFDLVSVAVDWAIAAPAMNAAAAAVVNRR